MNPSSRIRIASLCIAFAATACGGETTESSPSQAGQQSDVVMNVATDVGDYTVPERDSGLMVIDIRITPTELDFMHEYYDDEITADVKLTMAGKTWENVAFELHGGYARTVDKKSYRVEFPDDDKLELDLFEDGKSETQRRFVFHASWIDPTFIRNKLTFDLLREMGGLAPRVSYAMLYINGTWHGLYGIVERIDKLYLDRQGLPKTGNLYKAENDFANWKDKSKPMKGYDMVINEDNPTEDIDDLLDALTYTPLSAEEFQAEVEPRLELSDFHLWQMVHVHALNRDTFTKNYFLFHDLDAILGSANARFRIISWDTDATWGLNWDGRQLPLNESTWHGTDDFSPRLYNLDTYVEAYRALYLDALSDTLAPASVQTRVAAIASQIRTAAMADLEKWERGIDFDDVVATLKDAIQIREEVMKPVIEAL